MPAPSPSSARALGAAVWQKRVLGVVGALRPPGWGQCCRMAAVPPWILLDVPLGKLGSEVCPSHRHRPTARGKGLGQCQCKERVSIHGNHTLVDL